MNKNTFPSLSSKWLPTPGNLILTTLLLALFLYTQRANALPGGSVPQAPSATSTTTFPYQGRLTDTSGNPINATQAMTFRLYNVTSGGTALWTEFWPSVNASEGLFNVLLGSTTPIPQTVFTENTNLWLGIQVGSDTEMSPRVQVGSTPFARHALSIADAAITTSKLADGAVVSEKLNVTNVYSYVDIQESTNVNDWVSLPTPDVITITLTKPQIVNIYYGATAVTTTGNPAYITLSIDSGPALDEPFIEMWNGSITTISSIYQTQLSAGTHIIELKYKTSASATAYFWRRKILAFVISQ